MWILPRWGHNHCVSQRQPDPALERGFIVAVLGQRVDSEDELGELRELARGIHPSTLPAKSAALNSTANGYRERSNLWLPLHEAAAGRAYGARGGMNPEAKALGKAGG